ncbi:MAG: thermonuclease family protein [Synechococcus sp. LacPavin_0920_WC12_MAG_50_7]|nr:thermonuclease family protein [Synechococcus sp. LacPavin_0920_WC12_MAG_50_7]
MMQPSTTRLLEIELRQDKRIYGYILPHFSWLSAVAIASSSITTTVAAAEFKVLSVGDGDTIRVTTPSGANKTPVRFACIDAPETSQVLGIDARQALQEQLPIGAEVSLRTKATDRYGRTVAEVLKGTTNINQELVAAGAAFVYWQYIEGCDRETYSRLENEARLKSLGIWQVPGGIQRPWDYRRGIK